MRAAVRSLALVFAVALSCPACGNGSGTTPEEEESAQNFREFLVDLIENHTSDTTEPVPVNGREFDLELDNVDPNDNEDFRNN